MSTLVGFPSAGVLTESQSGSATNRSVVLTAVERAWVQKHPVVYWGADPQWPPFSSLDPEGRISGIDPEIVNLVAQRSGIKVEFVTSHTWSETLSKVINGQIDFIGGIARTEERERLLRLRFTETFCNFPTAIVTRKELPFLTSLHALGSRKITLPRDYATTEKIRELYPQIRVLLKENEEQCMIAVADGSAEATVLNLASASYIVHNRGLTNLKISGLAETDFFLSLAARGDAPELCTILQKGLSTISPKEKEAIYEDYITTDTLRTLNWKAWRRWLIYSIIAGTGITAAVLFRNYRLKREIDRRMAAEIALQQASDRLEDRSRQLELQTRQMEVLNKELVSSNEELEAFSYSVSHDLKAPLRRMRGFADILGLNLESQRNPETLRCVQSIKTEGGKMAQLIEALLALARTGEAQLHLAPVSLEEVVREAIAELQPEVQTHTVRWEVQPMPTVECDRRLIKQVFLNLLSNAAKFTRTRNPGTIKVGSLTGNSDDPEVVCFIQDNGVGFDQNHADELFKAFHRLHRYNEYEGSGIGLANVKRIVQKHGGRVWAESEAGSGATFYFSLLKDPRTQIPSAGSPSSDKPEKREINHLSKAA